MPNLDKLDTPALIRVLRKCHKKATRLLWTEYDYKGKKRDWLRVMDYLNDTAYAVEAKIAKLLEARAYVPLTDEIDY